jgi:ribose transport system ATP-binding protein
MTPATIKLTAIEKSYPGVKPLDRVDFDVLGGEIHALVGENGAGKSTLTRVMGGVIAPDKGDIAFRGKPTVWESPRHAKRAGVHIIHQELALFNELSVYENIMVGNERRHRLGVLDRRAMRAQARAVLARLGADIDAEDLVGRLSVADQQMVEIAKALIGDVSLIVLDEPTAVISGREVDLLFDNMRALRRDGVAIVYISHRLEEIFDIADRVTVLKDGRLVGTKPVSETDRGMLISMMVGRRFDDIYPVRPPPAARVGRDVAPRVKDVSFDLHAGEILGVAGMVGSGRSELAHAIFGSMKLDGGGIELAGKPVALATPASSIRAGVGFLTEDRKAEGLFLQLPIAANIVAPTLRDISRGGFLDNGAEGRIAREQIRSYAVAAVSPRQRVSNLSGGNQQKVLFSRWARVADKVLVLDEPTRGVDVGAKVEIYRIIRQLADRGLAVLLISSELPEVIGLSDRIMVMREGRKTGELEGADMTEENVMHFAVLSGHAHTDATVGVPA